MDLKSFDFYEAEYEKGIADTFVAEAEALAEAGRIRGKDRLMLEVADAVVSVWGAGRVGMHLAPRADAHDMGDSDLPATFGYVARELGKREIAFSAPGIGQGTAARPRPQRRRSGACYRERKFRAGWRRGGHRRRRKADAIAFGKLFIANPDLPRRFGLKAPLNPWNAETFYAEGAGGYTDYPALRRRRRLDNRDSLASLRAKRSTRGTSDAPRPSGSPPVAALLAMTNSRLLEPSLGSHAGLGI